MSPSTLPERPNLEFLKNKARRLLRQALAQEITAKARLAAAGITSITPKLADALHTIAREHGFDTWPALKLQIEVSAEDPLAALASAIASNDAAVVRAVLARQPSWQPYIDKPLPGGGFEAPALLAAVSKESREMVDALLEAGANINQRSLWWAGGFGVLDSASPEMAGYLMALGAELDIHSAARLGMVDRVREFLNADPSLIQARGGDGQLPLHFAASTEIASLLLDRGAGIDARDIDHESTAAQYMVCIGQPAYRHETARFLVSRGAQADILMASAIGDAALVESILNGDPDTIRITVSERNFPKLDPRSGGSIYIYGFGITKTPHMLAHQFGHSAVFDLLMQRSAPWLRLVQAAELGDQDLVEQILQRQPALFAKLTANAARRIVGVAVRNNTRSVELLVDRGWPVDAVLENGQTALHYAAWHGNLAMARILLSHGARVNVFETEHGGSPLAWALHGSLHGWERHKGDYAGVAQALLSAGAAIPKPEGPLEASDEVMTVIGQQLP